MDFAILQHEGLIFLFRWLHLFFGVIWIGLLYYFNFVQGAFMAEADAAAKSTVTQKLVPRALWWFRWGAAFTLLTGLLYLGDRIGNIGPAVFFHTSYGTAITLGAILGIT